MKVLQMHYLQEIVTLLDNNLLEEAKRLQKLMGYETLERAIAYQTIKHYINTGEVKAYEFTDDSGIGGIQEVVDYLDSINGNSRKQIKVDVTDLLMAGHIIQQNTGKLYTTVTMKVASSLLDYRIEDDRLREIECKEEGKEFVPTVYKTETLNSGATFKGDVNEAQIILRGFQVANLIFLDEGGKLYSREFETVNNNIVKAPLLEPKVEFEVRKAFKGQSTSTPLPVKILNSIPYNIDSAILNEAKQYGNIDTYTNKLALEVAEEFKDETFYFPYYGCSRVRVYTDTTCGFSPQADDLGKALIKNETLEATHDLTPEFIRMANDFMDGECPFEITPKNLLMIDYKEAPKYKYRMLQLQNDYKEYLWTGHTSANSDLDARCSGNQILSLIGGTNDATAHIGMEVVEHERDLYEQNAFIFKKNLEKDAPEMLELYPIIATRKPCKRPTMTDVYNATLTSIMDNFTEFGVQSHHVGTVAKVMQNTLKDSGGKNVEIMTWLKDSAYIISKEGNETISWVRPDGIVGSQTYVKQRELKIKKKIPYSDNEIKQAQMRGRTKPKGGWRHDLSARVLAPHLDIKGQKSADFSKHVNAIVADIVHSLDSCLAMKVISILKSKGIIVTRFVHDSLSVHMNHKQALYDAVVEASIWLFNSRFLEDLKYQWETKYEVELPVLPERGGYDANILKECKNYWS